MIWYRAFKCGREPCKDEHADWAPTAVTTEENVQRNELIEENRRGKFQSTLRTATRLPFQNLQLLNEDLPYLLGHLCLPTVSKTKRKLAVN